VSRSEVSSRNERIDLQAGAARKAGELSKKIEKAQGQRNDLVAAGHEVLVPKQRVNADDGGPGVRLRKAKPGRKMK
jgi:hypothetical protein